jgi:transposase InsO family protein
LDTGIRSTNAVAPNVLTRTFNAAATNRKWVADFTYIWTAAGWLYVAAVVDLFSRRVVGWSMSVTMTAQLVMDALVMAIWRRGGDSVQRDVLPPPDAHTELQSLKSIESSDTLAIHPPPFAAQQHPDAQGSKPRAGMGEVANRSRKAD